MAPDKRALPFKCVVCAHKPESYYGRLVFPEELEAWQDGTGEPPVCPNHKGRPPQVLIPA